MGNFSSLDFEDRALKGTFGRKTVRFSQFEVSYDNVSYIIVKSQQQVEELCERLRLEVFHVSLPQLPPKSPRSPRGGGTGTTPAADEYLIALAEKGASLADSRTLRTVKLNLECAGFSIFNLFFLSIVSDDEYCGEREGAVLGGGGAEEGVVEQKEGRSSQVAEAVLCGEIWDVVLFSR
jgi:hypothetical protein